MSYKNADREFLLLAGTRAVLPGARVIGRRLVPDEGHRFEKNPKTKTVILMKDNGTSVGSVGCECGLEGGGCDLVIINPGDIDEYAACVPGSGCGSSGLFCFMDFNFAGGLSFKLAM